jgi:hypothetical protein
MSKSLYELFETDEKIEKDGVKLKFGPASFHVRRAGGANRAFNAAFEEKTRMTQSRLQMAALSEEESEKILMDVYAETVVIGWDGVTDRKGSPLEFTKENFMQVMKDLPVVWRALRTEAANHENFLKQQAKAEGDQLGN